MDWNEASYAAECKADLQHAYAAECVGLDQDPADYEDSVSPEVVERIREAAAEDRYGKDRW